MARVLIEFQVDAKGAPESIKKVADALRDVGVDGKVVEDSLSRADKQLKQVADQGTHTGAALKELSGSAILLAGAFAGAVLSLRELSRAITQGVKDAMEEQRALSQLSSLVENLGGNSAIAVNETKALISNLQKVGISSSETLGGIRGMVVATGDYAQSMTAVSLASDVYLKTGIPLTRTLDLIKTLMEGQVKNISNTTKEWGLHATKLTTNQEALAALQEKYQGYGATVNDALSKTQSFTESIKDLWKTIGGWLIPIVTGATDVFKVLWAAVQAIALSLGHVVTGIIAAVSAMHQLATGDPTGALKTMRDWLEQSKKDWANWGDSVVASIYGTAEAMKQPAKLMVDPLIAAAAEAEKAVKRLKDQIKETDKTIGEMFKRAGARGGGAIYGANYFTIGELGYDIERRMTGLAETTGVKFGLVMGRAAEPGIEAGVEEAVVKSIVMSREMAHHFGDAFKDGFLTIFEGGDFKDAWTGLWRGLAGMAAEAFGGVFSSLMSGGTIAGGLEGTGLLTGGIGEQGPEKQKVNWAGVAMLGGGLLASYGAGRQNRALAAIGGGIAGAGAGASLGVSTGMFAGWVGAVVGGILGAVMGYFSSGGPKTYGYDINMGAGVPGGAPRILMGGGTGAIQEQEMTRQLVDRATQVGSSFRDLLRQMNVTFDKLPPILAAWKGSTGDLNAVFTAILRGELPRAILEGYRPLLEQGLGGIGVSGGRVAQLLDAFKTGDFDKALASLQAYVEALMRLQSLSEDLSKDLVTLQEELTRTVRETWLRTMEDTLEQIGEFSEGLDQLTSDEQVARAQQIGDLAEHQYQANLAYLQNLYDAQQEIGQAWEDMFLGFREAEAQEAGPEAQKAFYRTQLEKLRGQLTGAGSVEELQRIMQQIQQAGMALWRLGGTLPDMYGEGGGTREWVEQFLRDQQAAADILFAAWQEEVKAQNEALRLAIVAITDALTGENGLQGNLLRFRERLDDASDGLSRIRIAADDASTALEGLAGAGGVEPGYRRGA